MAASISCAIPAFGASASILNACVCSPSSVWPPKSAVCLRNGHTCLRAPRRSALHGNAFFLGAVSSGFGSSKREAGFAKLRPVGEKRRREGLASLRDDTAAIAETEETEKNSSSEKELISKLLYLEQVNGMYVSWISRSLNWEQLLVFRVEGSDRGAQLAKEEQANVASVVGQLEEYGIPEPLQNPLIFGDWDVAYSSNPTSPGGGYRSWLGRLIFKTKDMVQTIRAPDFVVNVVRFAFFGFIAGQVVLQGKLQALDKKLIQVDFEPPTIQIGPFKFNYGKMSSVKLAIIYLDDTIRLGRGSRGTIFIFTRR